MWQTVTSLKDSTGSPFREEVILSPYIKILVIFRSIRYSLVSRAARQEAEYNVRYSLTFVFPSSLRKNRPVGIL